MRRLPALLALASLCALAACGDRSGRGDGGTVIVGAGADADALLHPLIAGIQGRTIADLLFDRLAEVGPELNTVGDAGFLPRLAASWEWTADSLAIRFRLDPRARWHDGRPVRAADVVTGFGIIRDSTTGSPLRASTADIAAVTAVDSLTAEFRFTQRSPEQFYSAILVVPLPAHLVGEIPPSALRTSEVARAPVGSGRFRLVSWEPGARIELAAVRDHVRGRPHLDRVIFSISPDAAAGLARVKAGETDVWDPVPPTEVEGLATAPDVRIVTSPGFDYAFMAFNQRDPRDRQRPHPLFAEPAMRRAIAHGVDRATIVRAIFDTLALPSLGPFVRAQATADTTIRHPAFDRAVAEALLDSLGWSTRGADGVRRNGTRRLSFTVIVPSSSRARERAAVMIQEQLRGLGVEVVIERAEFQTFLARQQGGRFDAVMGGTRTTPSPRGIRGSWASDAIPGGGSQNDWRYRSAVVDSAVEAGLRAMDPVAARTHFRRAYQRIADDAAAIWLYELKNVAAVHRRLVLPAWRPDAWWLTLGEWRVDPAMRLPRDAAPATP